MAKIPLRAYIKEIENLIERGEIDQAIAHARNVLKSYPKHIDTYRLLGKAFLESQRYSEASDILQRVLSVIPDDFVSQIGMSIIREDEGNLDAAIWHMERAYEVQPFNPAIQEELRRLYGRRDGVEPPKIRLTRGALVRMYSRGELYPQAIAETRAALAEDTQRFDLLVLLARLYYQSDQKMEAIEVCSTLISKLPYCYEANLILANVLPGTSRAEDARKFQQRVYALDPYAAFTSPAAPTVDQVADQAVMVEQFDWETSLQETQAPDWTRTIGIEWENPEDEELPDWISELEPEVSQADTAEIIAEIPPAESAQETGLASEITEITQPEENMIPDWMQEAGWAATDRSADEIMAAENLGADEISPAEIPDWLQSIAPVEAALAAGDETEADSQNEWLESLLAQDLAGEEEEPAQESGSTTLAGDIGPDAPTDLPTGYVGELSYPPDNEDKTPDELPVAEQTFVTPAEEIPDWLASPEVDQAQEEGQTDDVPDWLSGLTESEEVVTSQVEVELPDWLQINEDEPGEEGALDWLQPLSAASPKSSGEALETEPTNLIGQEPEAVQKQADVSAEMSQLNESPAEESRADVPDLSGTAATLAWLETLEANQGALEEAIGPAPQTASEELPEWIKQEIAPVEAPEDTQPPEAVLPEFDLDDEDAAMAWLESLAARQGADEETLITPPDQRTETPPDWLLREIETAEATAQAEAAAPSPELEEKPGEQPVVEPPQAESIDVDEAFSWLESLAARQGAEEDTLITKAEDRLETPPAWALQNQIDAEPEMAPSDRPDIEFMSHEEAVEEAAADEDSAGEVPAEEYPPISAEPAAKLPADAVLGAEEPDEETIPDWLKDIGEAEPEEMEQPWHWVQEETGPEPVEGQPQPEGETNLPDWLRETGADETAGISPEQADDRPRPDWLAGEVTGEETILPMSSEFHAAWEPASPAEEAASVEPATLLPASLVETQAALSQGNLESALSSYASFIEKREFLEETINDLRDALYRYPVDINIWQALGDAYAQNDQLQEALDAYSKAEELLR